MSDHKTEYYAGKRGRAPDVRDRYIEELERDNAALREVPHRWKLTRDVYPTPADQERELVVAIDDGIGGLMVKQLSHAKTQFSTCNFGSTPMWWAYVEDILPPVVHEPGQGEPQAEKALTGEPQGERVCRERDQWHEVASGHARALVEANGGARGLLERAERAEQRALLAEHSVTVCKATIDALALKIDSAEREAAEYKRDAARWQAIKPYFRVMSPDIGGRHYWTLRGGVPRGANMDEVADAAIDAARRGNERPLVKRLRDYARDYTGTNYHDRLIHEAADRIEQLERDSTALREVLKDIKTARDGHYWTAELDAKISTALSQTKGKA